MSEISPALEYVSDKAIMEKTNLLKNQRRSPKCRNKQPAEFSLIKPERTDAEV